jgi:hypothetical protein
MEHVLSVFAGDRQKIYPFPIIKTQEVINDHVNGLDLVVFFRKGTVSVLDHNFIRKSRDVGSAMAFNRMLDGRTLHFENNKGSIVDRETRSRWLASGLCVEGPLEGKFLDPVAQGQHFAFAWLNFYPDSLIFDP